MWKFVMIYGFIYHVAGVQRINNETTERYNYFNIELLQIVNDLTEGNIVISPLGIRTALSILLEGTGGRTREELLSTLRLPTNQQDARDISRKLIYSIQNCGLGTEIKLANRLWIGQPILISNEFNNLLRTYYGGDTQSIEFANAASSDIINNWVRQATKDHICSIVERGTFSGDMELILTSALYFKAKWMTAFDENQTKNRTFYIPGGKSLTVPMMEDRVTLPYANIPSLNAEVLEIPYSDGKLSMLIFLPTYQGLQHLRTLSKDLAHKPISELLGSLQDTDLILRLPRFNIQSKINLQTALEYLGIRDLFNFNANLTGILPNGGSRVGNVIHSAKIEINEQGTIASAATAFVIIPLIGSSNEVFTVDRPFLFTIIDRSSGAIVFAGRVIEP